MAEVAEILRELKYFRVPFPSAEVADAIAHKDEITPHLLDILKQAAEDPEVFNADDDICVHLFALFLLAKFREQRAWPLILKIISAPDGGEELLGDVITEGLSAIIASVCGDDLSNVKALIENPATDEWVRSSALDALVRLVAVGRLSRDEAMQYFAHLYNTLEREPGEIWDALGNSSLDLCPKEVLDELQTAYDEELIDENSFGQDEIEEALSQGPDGTLRRLREGPHRRLLVDDVEREMSWMSGFYSDEDEPLPRTGSIGVETFVRLGPKIGRNDPCPCGSGKKFKKCCGA
jgi:hypothetical protein